MRRISARDDRGTTAIEIMMVTLIMTIVVVSIIGLFRSVQQGEAYSQSRVEMLDEMRTAMQRMSKEIRQAEAVLPGSSSTTLIVDTYVAGTKQQITYAVAGNTLTRTDAVSGTVVIFQRELVSTDVFTYSPTAADPKVVEITLHVRPPRRPETTLVLTSEVRPRNVERAA